MELTFGEHEGETTERLMLTEPGYVSWILNVEKPSKAVVAARFAVKRHLRAFDQKAFQRQCQASDCSVVAVRAIMYQDNPGPTYWCATCDPYQLGAQVGKLQDIFTLKDALYHAQTRCDGNKKIGRALLLEICRAKGLPIRATDTALQAFFA